MSNRILDYPEATAITSNDYILLDNEGTGAKCIKASALNINMDNYTIKEARGAIASFDDGEDLPLAFMGAYIEPQQDLSHGDPSPTNICPIRGWDEVNVTKTGKNLWGGEKLADDIVAKVPNATKDTTNKTVSYSAGYVSGKVLFDNFKPNTIYTIFIMTSSSANNIMVRYTDGTNTYINKDSITVTQANKSIECIIGIWSTGTTVLKYEECGVFEGVITADDFEPYSGQTYTISLNGTRYGGKLDVVSGVLTVDRAYVDLGTLDWQYSSISERFYVGATDLGVKATDASTAFNAISSALIAKSYNEIEAKTVDYAISINPNATQFFARYSTITSASDFITAMNGVQLVYELATPLTYSLTKQQIKSLVGENNIFADTGDSVVDYRKLWVTPEM